MQAYTIIWFIIVMVNIVGFCAETMDIGEVRMNITIRCKGYPLSVVEVHKAKSALRYIDFVSCVLFTLDFLVRLVVCPNKRKFFRSPMTYVHVLAMVPSYVYFILIQVPNNCYYTYINEIDLVMFLRVLRVFRIIYLLRFYGPFQILMSALKISGHELMMLGTFLTITVLIYGTLIFYIERTNFYLNESPKFPDIPSGLWWAIVTMTTLGYGDKVPHRALGFVVGSMAAVTGILIVALAVPIVSSNFCKLYDFYSAKRRLKKGVKEVPSSCYLKTGRGSMANNDVKVSVL